MRRGRSRGTVVAVVIGAGLLTVLGILPAAAQTTETFRDEFSGISYTGSNGTLPWSDSWAESGESDGPSGGRVRVVTHSACVAGNCGRLTANGNTTAGLQREADLDGALSATLSYGYQRTSAGGKAGLVRVSVSADGGGSWSTLRTYVLDATDGGPIAESIVVTPFATAQTQVRFRVESSPGETGTFFFDNVQLAAVFPGATSTTTTTTATSTTTVTTTGPPTSTSEPPSTSGAPTTTGAPSTTSSTLPPGPSSSTTVAPAATAAPPTSPPGATAPPSTTVAAAPVLSAAPPPFPVVFSDEVAAAVSGASFLGAGAQATDPGVSKLVLEDFADYGSGHRTLPPSAAVADSLSSGAAAGARAAVPVLIPLGLAAGGFLFTLLSRRRASSRAGEVTG